MSTQGQAGARRRARGIGWMPKVAKLGGIKLPSASRGVMFGCERPNSTRGIKWQIFGVKLFCHSDAYVNNSSHGPLRCRLWKRLSLDTVCILLPSTATFTHPRFYSTQHRMYVDHFSLVEGSKAAPSIHDNDDPSSHYPRTSWASSMVQGSIVSPSHLKT